MKKQNTRQKHLFVFVGLPGSGKTTVCAHLAKKYPKLLIHTSVGDLLRAEAQKETERGNFVQGFTATGTLVPFPITIALLDEFFKNNEKAVILLDGYQGTIEWIQPLHDLLDLHAITLSKVFHFSIPVDRAVERCAARLRNDDTAQALHSRMQSRLMHIGAIQQWYEKNGLFAIINAENSVEEVVTLTESYIFYERDLEKS